MKYTGVTKYCRNILWERLEIVRRWYDMKTHTLEVAAGTYSVCAFISRLRPGLGSETFDMSVHMLPPLEKDT